VAVALSGCALIAGCGSTGRSLDRSSRREGPTSPRDSAYYNQVIDKLTAEQMPPSAIDFARFRLSVFRNRPHRARPEVYERLSAAINRERYGEAILLGDSVLLGNFADIRAHVYTAAAYKRTGDIGTYDMHMLFANGMLHSIVDGTTGRSVGDAFGVYFVENEPAVLEYLDLEMQSQALVESNGRTYDRIRCVDPHGAEVDIYFDITEHVERLLGARSGQMEAGT